LSFSLKKRPTITKDINGTLNGSKPSDKNIPNINAMKKKDPLD
jgi:hypothetical protein